MVILEEEFDVEYRSVIQSETGRPCQFSSRDIREENSAMREDRAMFLCPIDFKFGWCSSVVLEARKEQSLFTSRFQPVARTLMSLVNADGSIFDDEIYR